MDNRDNITIIIPAFNAESSIKKSLDSVRKQTFQDFEVVVIDDGSIDNTSIIVKEFVSKDSRFKYFYQENAGVSIARNKGIELSEGDYICFLDADDYFERTYLEKMYNRITESNSDVCYCGYNIITGSLSKVIKTKFKRGDILLERILGKINVPTSGWILKKELLEKENIKFPKNISWGEDFEFFNEVVANTNKVSFVDEYLTNYVVGHNENQLSSFSLDKIDKDYESIMRCVKNTKVNKDTLIEKALIDYRLHGAIIYRLLSAINKKYNENEIEYYYEKYIEYIKNPTFNNGLRSIKLNLNRIKLIYLMNKR